MSILHSSCTKQRADSKIRGLRGILWQPLVGVYVRLCATWQAGAKISTILYCFKAFWLLFAFAIMYVFIHTYVGFIILQSALVIGTLAATQYHNPHAILLTVACFMLPAFVLEATAVVYLCAQFEASRLFLINLIGFRSYRLYVGQNPGSKAVGIFFSGAGIALGGAGAALFVFKGCDQVFNTANLNLEHRQTLETIRELRQLETDFRQNSHFGGSLVQQALDSAGNAAQGPASEQQAAFAAQAAADRAAFEHARAQQLAAMTERLTQQLIDKSTERMPRHNTAGRLLDIAETAVKGFFDSRSKKG